MPVDQISAAKKSDYPFQGMESLSVFRSTHICSVTLDKSHAGQRENRNLNSIWTRSIRHSFFLHETRPEIRENGLALGLEGRSWLRTSRPFL